MSILFINGCVREPSRTLVLAKHVLSGMRGEVTEVNLIEENMLKGPFLSKDFIGSSNDYN